MTDNDVKEWVKEVVANGYHGHMRPIEEDVLGYFYECLFEAYETEVAVDILMNARDESTAGYYLNKAVMKAIERTTGTFETSVAAHLRELDEICGD